MFEPSQFSGSAPNMPESHLARLLREIANMEKSRSRHRRGTKVYAMYTRNIARLKKEVAAIRAKERASKKARGKAKFIANNPVLAKHIRTVKVRIGRIRKAIRTCKRNVLVATGATALTGGAAAPAVVALLVHLHKMERALHHNRALLQALYKVARDRKANPKVLAAVVQVAAATAAAPVETPPAAAAAADPAYPAPETPAPDAKDAATVVEEAKTEAAEPAAADAHDDAAAGKPVADEHDVEASATVSASADAGGSLLKKPLFWVGVAGVGIAYYKRDKLKMLLAAGRA